MKIRATLLESIGNVSVVDRELEPGDTGILVKTTILNIHVWWQSRPRIIVMPSAYFV